MPTLKATTRPLLPLLALLCTAVLLAACGLDQPTPTATPAPTVTPIPVGKAITTDKGKYTNVSVDEFKAMMDHKDFFLVDVHTPNEGKLPNLDARIPYDQITQQLDKLPADKSAKIVLTCMSGGMSTQASTQLADLGYTNVYNLVGGYNAWKAKGYEFTNEP